MTAPANLCILLACSPLCSLARTPRPAPLPTDLPAAFTGVDVEWLERLGADLGARRWSSGL